MGSGAIYAVIVGLWAVVLIPLWLRNHDRSGEAKQIDKYLSAMTSLSTRGTSSPTRSTRETSVREHQQVDHDDEWHEPTAAELAASRRRMVMAILAGLLAGALILVLLGVLPLWFLVLPAVLLIGFGGISRQQATRAEQKERRESQRYARPAPPEAAPAPRRYASVETRPAPAPVPAPSAELPEVRRVEALPAQGEGWDPVSAPLPTYVSAPRASRVPRVIDLAHTGEWSGDAMVQEAQRVRAGRGDEIFDQFSDQIDDDAFFDQLAEQTRGRRASEDFFDQNAPRAVGD